MNRIEKLETAIVQSAVRSAIVCSNAANTALSTKWGKAVMSGTMAASALTIKAHAAEGAGDAQAVLDTIMGILGPGVIALGALVGIVGGIQLGTSFTRQDAGSKTEGMMSLVAGVIIAGVGGLVSTITI